MLTLPLERRITARDALGSGWLQLEDEEQEEIETEGDSAGPALPEVPAPSGAEAANGDSLQSSSKEGFHNRMAITADVNDQKTSTKKSPAPRRKSKVKSTEGVVDSDTEEASKPKKGKKEADVKAQRETEVLFLRHRLQRGFLSKGKDPVEEVGHSCL